MVINGLLLREIAPVAALSLPPAASMSMVPAVLEPPGRVRLALMLTLRVASILKPPPLAPPLTVPLTLTSRPALKYVVSRLLLSVVAALKLMSFDTVSTRPAAPTVFPVLLYPAG